MDRIEKTYYTIGEVSTLLGEAPSLIRFWEKEFAQLKPSKTGKGTRKYDKKDIELLQLIHHLVKEKGYTLDGARDFLRTKNRVPEKAAILSRLKEVKSFLEELNAKLQV